MQNRIREVLAERGMTQKELAEKVGMTEMGVSKAADGSATKATLDKIAKVFGIEAEELVDESNMRHAKYEGVLHIGELDLDVAVLDNGQRIIRQADVFRAFDRPARGNTRVTGIPTFMDAKNLQNFVDEEVMRVTKRVRFLSQKGQNLSGYDCKILPAVCELYLQAREAGLLTPNQAQTAQKAESLMRSFAKVGIIALVDEATGYDKEKGRAKDELQRFLSMFLQEEAAQWVKTFPDQFFEDIYKMHGWTWNYTSKRPGVVGKYISDIVYERLGPIAPMLEELNPKDDNGNRKKRHHQYLSRESGLPKLKEHLASLHTIAIMSDYNWKKFKYNVDKVFPKKYGQLLLDLEFDD